METVAPPDASAEAALLTEVSTLALRFARRRVAAADADDIAQDVVLDCLVRLRTGRWHLERSLPAFVKTAVWRKLSDASRRTRHREARDSDHMRQLEECPSAWMNPELAREERELGQLVARAMTTLPRACRQAFVMVREEQATYEAAAERLGIARSTVGTHVATAHRRLRRQLRQQGIAIADSRAGSREAARVALPLPTEDHSPAPCTARLRKQRAQADARRDESRTASPFTKPDTHER